MRKFNEEQQKFIARIFAIQNSATQVRRVFLHHYGFKGGRKRSQFTAKDYYYYRQEFRYSWSSSATRTFTSTEMNMKTIGE